MSAFNEAELKTVAMAVPPVVIGASTLHLGDCIEIMRTLADCSVDSVVTDPPYGISFMGKAWDGADIKARTARRRGFATHAPDAGPNGGHKSIAAEAGKYDLTPAAMRAFQEFSEEWAREALRVLKPGGHLMSFSSARTFHRMVCGIEDAGFEIRDQIAWVFGSGFPKSHNISKNIDKAMGAEREVIGKKSGRGAMPVADLRGGNFVGTKSMLDCSDVTAPTTGAAVQWDGWGTALKPAHEPICVARKPLIGTVVANVLAHGTGALNIDACRIAISDEAAYVRNCGADRGQAGTQRASGFSIGAGAAAEGRWPANLIHDGSDEVLALFPAAKGQQGHAKVDGAISGNAVYGALRNATTNPEPRVESETSAARFFYCAKASRADRNAGLVDPGPVHKHGVTLRQMENAVRDGVATGNTHPTVKPTDLMAYLVRLVTPAGGVVLDPFMGSGSTGKACMREGLRFIGIDLSTEYFPIAAARIEHEIDEVAAAELVAAEAVAPAPQLNLFAEVQP